MEVEEVPAVEVAVFEEELVVVADKTPVRNESSANERRVLSTLIFK